MPRAPTVERSACRAPTSSSSAPASWGTPWSGTWPTWAGGTSCRSTRARSPTRAGRPATPRTSSSPSTTTRRWPSSRWTASASTSRWALNVACGGVEIAREPQRLEEFRRRVTSAKAWGIDAWLVSPKEVLELVPVRGRVDHPRRLLHPERLRGGLAAGRHAVPGAGTGEGRAGQLRQRRGAGPRDGHRPDHGRRHRPGSDRDGARRDRLRRVEPSHRRDGRRPHPAHAGRAPDDRRRPDPRSSRRPATRSATRSCATWTCSCTSARPPARWRSARTPTGRSSTGRTTSPPSRQSRLSPTELPFTAEDFDQQLEDALELMPDLLATAEIKYAINGLLSLTPDGFPLLGETPEVRNLWSAAAVWIKEGPGAGRLLAEWMTHGVPEIDPHQSDIARFYPYARNDHHVRARCAEHFNKTYGIVHPREQWASERNLRCAPYHARTEALGAVYFQAGGLGASALVHLQRAAGRALRRRGPSGRVGRPLVVAHQQRRAPGHAGAGRDGRPRAVRRVRRQRARGARLPADAWPSTTATWRSGDPCTRRCSTTTAASAPTSRSCASARRASGWSPAPSTAHATSTGSASTCPLDGSVTFDRPDLGAVHDRRLGSTGPGSGRSSVTDADLSDAALPLRHDAGGAVRLAPGAPLPDLLRGRAGLGDLRPDGERAAGLGRAVGGGPGPRRRRRRRRRLRHDAAAWRRATG